jgi:hypothetical protein
MDMPSRSYQISTSNSFPPHWRSVVFKWQLQLNIESFDQVDWDGAALEKSMGAIEEAVLAAAQDAVADTRTAGRAAFAAYCRARPERLHPLLARQDPGLQQKLRDALVAYVPGALLHAMHFPVPSVAHVL